jgi:hypothetical protein
MQQIKLISIFSFLFSQHVSALAGHHQTSTTRKRQHQHAGGENEEQQGQT